MGLSFLKASIGYFMKAGGHARPVGNRPAHAGIQWMHGSRSVRIEPAPEPGLFYCAWGCFRDFVPGACPAPNLCVPGHPVETGNHARGQPTPAAYAFFFT